MSQNMDTKILLFLCNLKFLCYNSIVEKGGSMRIQHQQDKEYVAHASILEIHQKGWEAMFNGSRFLHMFIKFMLEGMETKPV